MTNKRLFYFIGKKGGLLWKKIITPYRRWRYFRNMNKGLFFLVRLDKATEGIPKNKSKQFWRDIKSPASRIRVFKELFEILNK